MNSSEVNLLTQNITPMCLNSRFARNDSHNRVDSSIIFFIKMIKQGYCEFY